MSHTGPRRHLLCYDISDAKRLGRVHRRVRRDGMALQYSLFDCQLDQARLQKLMADLRELIDLREDDVRIYGPRLDAPVTWIGASPFPEGVLLFNNPKEAARGTPGPSPGPTPRDLSFLLPSVPRQGLLHGPDAEKGFGPAQSRPRP